MVSKVIRYASDKQAAKGGRETYVFYFHPLKLKINLPRFIGRVFWSKA
ncbi:hypothetical protein JCM15765_08730 [Paradesulfitobacterium aromaticivorans]